MFRRSDSQLTITDAVYESIARTIGAFPPEQGGLLGGSHEDGIVRHYYFDDTSARSGVTYSPDHMLLSSILAEDWNPQGVRLLGFAHSHPSGCTMPSGGDLIYARRILESNPDLTRLLLPIVIGHGNPGFELGCFAAVRNGKYVEIEELRLNIVHERDKLVRRRVMNQSRKELRPFVPGFDVPHDWNTGAPTQIFQRVRTAYDLKRAHQTRFVMVGCGGAISFIESCARAGIGEFVLFDGDIVDACNIGTQNVYIEDVGRSKVVVVAARIRSINPNAKVVSRKQRLEEISDEEFTQLVTEPLGRTDDADGREPVLTVLFGLTDNFEAQARVNRLALNLGLPSLCAQVYRQGRGAEITFTHPSVTPACHRCALSSRYRQYIEENYRNEVTSDGTPIWSTERLNALKGEIAMALVHHGTGHPRYGKLLSEIGNRNLIQIRMDPEIDKALDIGVFKKVFAGADAKRILYDETIWLPQKPDCPENGFPRCPDCGGTGDLRDAIGTFDDTRRMRRHWEAK